MASTYLSKSAVTGNRRTFTISAWVKRSGLGTAQQIYSSRSTASNVLGIYFQTDNTLWVTDYQSGAIMSFYTNRVFRDVNAWYHIVLEVDTTQATESSRVKIYVNGTQETSFSTASYPTQNRDLYINVTGSNHYIGTEQSGRYFDGAMAHVHFIDGTAYAASDFGSFDANGIWTPNASPSVTYGTNGFFLNMASSGDMGNDVSGNNNDFTVTGTVTQALDTPSNVFATLNPLDTAQSNATFSNGNTTWTTTSGYFWGRSTLGVSSGKYYFEAKLSSAPEHGHIGIVDEAPENNTDSIESGAYNWGYKLSDGEVYNNGSGTAYGDTYTTGDIIGVALDLDNNKLYFSKNGTWQNSGDPESGATGTGAVSITDPSSTNTGNYFFAVGDNASATNGTWQTNFGNGYFGTTAVASGNPDSAGLGIFEYTVPSGYYSLCTKNLATYG